jgi:hypothetical protein
VGILQPQKERHMHSLNPIFLGIKAIFILYLQQKLQKKAMKNLIWGNDSIQISTFLR